MATIPVRQVSRNPKPSPPKNTKVGLVSSPDVFKPVDRRSGAIPVSTYPPLQLARPLAMFGKGFQVHVSSALTLSLDTTLQAIFGMSQLTLIRNDFPQMHLTMKKLIYSGLRKHVPSAGTKRLITQTFEKFINREALFAVLNGKEPPPTPQESDWNTVLRGMGGNEGEFFFDVATHLAAFDAQLADVRRLALNNQPAEAKVQSGALLGDAEQAWQAINPCLSHKVMLLVEIALKTLVWIECKSHDSNRSPLPVESKVAALLSPKRRPMGNWLAEVRVAYVCSNLSALSTKLFGVNAKHHGRAVSYDLLKKWSSSKDTVMPPAAVTPVLSGVLIDERADLLKSRFYVARFLTFICDLTWAGTEGATPVWAQSQKQIESRYAQLYRLESDRLRVKA
jgi:hypothetical protein